MDLAGAHQVIEATQYLFHRRDVVAHVRPEQVNVIGVQAFEAFFDGAHHVLAVVAELDRAFIAGLGAQAVLGGDHQVVALGGDKFTQQLFSLAELVTVGGIEEIAACFEVAVEYLLGFIALGAMPPARTEIAGAQGQF